MVPSSVGDPVGSAAAARYLIGRIAPAAWAAVRGRIPASEVSGCDG